MKQNQEERIFQNLMKKVKDQSIYEEMNKNSIDKNIVKKISILFEIFNHINKVRSNSSQDFVYTNDVKYCLRHDNFVKVRFHLIPLERKKLHSVDEKNFNFIQNVNQAVSNIYDSSTYDQRLNSSVEDEEKLHYLMKKLNEIEHAYIYKYRSTHNIKLTFDVFCHNFYIFLSYDYKKHLSIQNFKNKYNMIEVNNEFKCKASQNMLQLNSMGLVLNNHDNEYERDIMDRLNPFIFESEHMIKELHVKKNIIRKDVELENEFFLKNFNYEDHMRMLLHFEKVKDEYKRLKKSVSTIQPMCKSGAAINYL